MWKRKIQVCLLILLLAISLSACTAKAPSPSTSGSGENKAVVTDQAGREVEINGRVERIVSSYYISSSACIALGLVDKLVGIEARAASRPIYSLVVPKLLDLPSVGTARDFNLEACIALKPDLVILPLRLRDAANTLKEVGIPGILVNPESYTELQEMIALIGKATGTMEAADRLLNYYERSTINIRNLTVELSDANKPTVYMCGVSSYLTAAPIGMYQSDMIIFAGGKNATGVEGNSWVEIPYEHLLAINPEVIIIPAEAGFGVADVSGDVQLQRLDAVMSGRVYKMPSVFEAWDSPVPSCILGTLWLLHVLHGDLYSIESLRKEAAFFYDEFFGIKIDTALIEKLNA